MKTKAALIYIVFIFIVGVGVRPGLSQAQTQSTPTLTTEASRMDSLAVSHGEGKVGSKLSADFSSFLGTDSRAVVTGLRNGTPIILTRTAPSSVTGAPPVTTKTTINPPTGKMGWGNVFISLALAKQELSQAGITQPTPQQLQAALVGGKITTGTGANATTTNLRGILTMRSQHMGWGRIAHELGYKLGPVVSGMKAANHGLASGTVSPSGSGIVSASGQPVGSSQGGVVSGSGRSLQKSGKGHSGRSDSGQGIVTGSGRPVGSQGSITTGRGHADGVSHGANGGLSHGKGHNR